MTLRMADGPVANLPPGLDAYAGYVNRSGIGITFPAVQALAASQNAKALSITTNGSPAQVADVESGAMTNWKGYQYGYCAVSNVNALVAKYGRPSKLWTAHYDPKYGAHICSPACWPGLVTTADGTQWTDHGGAWDESLLSDNFFGAPAPAPAPKPGPVTTGDNVQIFNETVAVSGGSGWLPSPVSAAKFVNGWFAVENPDVVGHYDTVPTVVQASATPGPHSPNGAIIVRGMCPDGTYSIVLVFES